MPYEYVGSHKAIPRLDKARNAEASRGLLKPGISGAKASTSCPEIHPCFDYFKIGARSDSFAQTDRHWQSQSDTQIDRQTRKCA